MNKYLNTNNNTDEISEIQGNDYSNFNINYNNISTNNNITQSNYYNNTNNIETENCVTSDNNIESEIETDLKKYAKAFNSKNMMNKRSSFKNNNIPIQEGGKKVDIIEDYLMKLKNYGYPEMGKIYLSPVYREQEKTHNFFEFFHCLEHLLTFH